MSDALYPVRLYWTGQRGVAKCAGVSLALSAPPALPFSCVEIDYAPGVVGQVRRRDCDPLDELSVAECRAVREYLAGLVLRE